MCGRTCLTLQPDELKCACKYKKDKVEEKDSTPTFRNEFNLGLNLKISQNMCPGELCPIIVSAKQFDSSADPEDRMILPALWGLIPRWHKGDFKKHGLTTNNARIESISQSRLYKPVLNSQKRCVLPVEGFYEWQTVNPKLKSSERPVYFIHMPQEENVKIEDKSTWKNVKLMFIAGLFDVWHDDEGDSLYSFTIITYESDEKFSWLHHRTPAILETEQQVSSWLNIDSTPPDEALKLIKHPKSIVWYPVSNAVNNSRNKSETCKNPKIETPKKNSLLDWVKKRKSDGPTEDSKDLKRAKEEK